MSEKEIYYEYIIENIYHIYFLYYLFILIFIQLKYNSIKYVFKCQSIFRFFFLTVVQWTDRISFIIDIHVYLCAKCTPTYISTKYPLPVLERY